MSQYSLNDWMAASSNQTETTEIKSKIVEDFAQAMELGILPISKLLRELDPFINDSDDLVGVSRALSLLPEVFDNTALGMDKRDVHLLVEYFCTRLENREELPNFYAGIGEIPLLFRALTKLKKFPPGEVIPMIKAIFFLAVDSMRFKELPDPIRLKMFNFVDYLFRSHKEILIRDMGINALVSGLVAMAVFEKKISCLETLFPLFNVVVQSYPIEDSHLDQIYTSFIRYFPISINRMPKSGGTECRDLLLQLICSTDYYADRVFTHCLDLLDSTTSDLAADTKQEVLIALHTCVQNYNANTATRWSSKIWDAVKFEIWNGENDIIINSCLRILQAIELKLRQGSSEWGHDDNTLAMFVLEIIRECQTRIQDSQKKYSFRSSRIISTLGSSSCYSFSLVSKNIVPAMFRLWRDRNLGSEKKMLLEILNTILEARLKLVESTQVPLGNDTSNMITEFAKYQETLVGVYSSAIFELKRAVVGNVQTEEDPSENFPFMMPTLKGISMLFKIPGYLSGVEQGMVTGELIQIRMNWPTGSTFHSETLATLRDISVSNPDIYGTMVLSPLLERLPDYITTHPHRDEKQLIDVTCLLDDIADISCHPCDKELEGGFPLGAFTHYWHRNFDRCLECLLDKLDAVFLFEGQLCYATAIVAALLRGVKTFDAALNKSHLAATGPVATVHPYNQLFQRLYNKTIHATPYPRGHLLYGTGQLYQALYKPPHEGDVLDEKYVRLAAEVNMIICRSRLNTTMNNIIFNNLAIIGIKNGLEDMDELATANKAKHSHLLLMEPELPDKAVTLIVTVFMMAGLQPAKGDDQLLTKTKSILGINKHTADIAIAMVEGLADSSRKFTQQTRLAMLWYIQILVAKFHCTRESFADGRTLLGVIEHLFESLPSANDQLRKIYQIVAYTGVASYYCYDHCTLVPMFRLLSTGLDPTVCPPKIGFRIAQCFRLFLQPSPILNEENYMPARPLRGARIFELTVPLFTAWRTHTALVATNPDHKKVADNHLIAISGVLARLKSSFYLEDHSMRSTLVHIALEGTNVSNEEWSKSIFLAVVHTLVKVSPDDMVQHVDTLLARMTERTHNTLDNPSDADPKSRIFALQVLFRMISSLAFKKVLIGRRAALLTAELDIAKQDCHAAVRALAQRCLSAWHGSIVE